MPNLVMGIIDQLPLQSQYQDENFSIIKNHTGVTSPTYRLHSLAHHDRRGGDGGAGSAGNFARAVSSWERNQLCSSVRRAIWF